MASAFVTGASGFLGRNLVGALRQQGYDVRALVRSPEAAATVRELGAEPIMGDLDTQSAIQQAMNGCETVFHLAAYLGDWGRYEDAYRVNVTGTENVLAAARNAKVPRLVHVSTEAVLVGSGAPKIIHSDETWPLPKRPIGIYPATKALAEERVRAANSAELATIIVRPRFIWGKDDTNVLKQLVQAVQKGGFAWIGGKHLTSTTNVTNVCEGTILAAQPGHGGETYFLTDGAPIEFRSFVTAMLETQGVKPGNRSIPFGAADATAWLLEKVWQLFKFKATPPLTRTTAHLFGQEVTVNDSKARRELGYVGAKSREAGLAEMRIAASGQTK